MMELFFLAQSTEWSRVIYDGKTLWTKAAVSSGGDDDGSCSGDDDDDDDSSDDNWQWLGNF